MKTKSVFIQMHDGTRTGEGSFNQGLKELFYLSDHSNKCKLVKAFPEFFGDEVPEFGVYKQSIEQKFAALIEKMFSKRFEKVFYTAFAVYASAFIIIQVTRIIIQNL